jgi:hypothetical protein
VFAENLAAFFDANGFATSATYDGATTVNVIFDAAYIDTLGMAATSPVALGMASDFPDSAVGKTLLIGATTYTIRNRQPQDDGAFVLLQLTNG